MPFYELTVDTAVVAAIAIRKELPTTPPVQAPIQAYDLLWEAAKKALVHDPRRRPSMMTLLYFHLTSRAYEIPTADRFSVSGDRFERACVSPDGSTVLALGRHELRIRPTIMYLWQPDTKRLDAEVLPYYGRYSCAFSPNGTHFVVAVDGTSALKLVLYNTERREALSDVTIPPLDGTSLALSVFEDNNVVAVYSSTMIRVAYFLPNTQYHLSSDRLDGPLVSRPTFDGHTLVLLTRHSTYKWDFSLDNLVSTPHFIESWELDLPSAYKVSQAEMGRSGRVLAGLEWGGSYGWDSRYGEEFTSNREWRFHDRRMAVTCGELDESTPEWCLGLEQEPRRFLLADDGQSLLQWVQSTFIASISVIDIQTGNPKTSIDVPEECREGLWWDTQASCSYDGRVVALISDRSRSIRVLRWNDMGGRPQPSIVVMFDDYMRKRTAIQQRVMGQRTSRHPME